jgi:hypothetical protein
MSIATLKKKTQTQYHNMSVNSKNGFSLNGTHRSQGYVGQTMLSRSLPKTMMRGNTIRGYGGCCGEYKVCPIVQSAVLSLNDTNVVKASVVNNDGMIATKYKWINRPDPETTVKPDSNQNINTGSQYTTLLAKKTISDMLDPSCNVVKTIDTTNPVSSCKTTDRIKGCIGITKPESQYVAITAGEYLYRLHNDCVKNDKAYVAKKTQGAPYAGFN